MSHKHHQTKNTHESHSITNPSQTQNKNLWKTSNPISRISSSRVSSPSSTSTSRTHDFTHNTNINTQERDLSPLDSQFSTSSNSDLDSDDEDDMEGRRPPLHRPTDGRSHQPLLNNKNDDIERGRSSYNASPDPPERSTFSRRSTMRSRSPDTQAKLATKKKYTYAAFFLGVSLVSFVIQTETAVYIQHQLGWNKAYCMLYVLPWC